MILHPLRRLLRRRPLVPSSLSHFHTTASMWGKVHKFKLADIGEGITECEIVKWSIKPHTQVSAFDPLCEVQSDKASVEITSPFDGVVTELLVPEGEVAKVGAGLCLIEVEDESLEVEDAVAEELGGLNAKEEVKEEMRAEDEARLAPNRIPEEIHSESPAPTTTTSQRKPHPLDPSNPSSPPLTSTEANTEVLAAPSVRHFARQQRVDLAHVAPGSGKGGRIEKSDVEAYITKQSAGKESASSSSQQGDVVVELGRTRYGMYKAMTKSLEIPHFGYTTSLDITALHGLLPILNAHIPSQYLPASSSSSPSSRQRQMVDPSALYPTPSQTAESVPDSARFVKLTYLPVMLKMLSKAMEEWPLFRASITPSSTSPTSSYDSTSASPSSNPKPTLTIRPTTDISIALSTPSGLYTPTIPSVSHLSIYALASQLRHLSQLARQTPSALTPKEMPKKGGTITVSNIGAVGRGEAAMPLLVPGGGVAIVALGRARWVWDVDGVDVDEYHTSREFGEGGRWAGPGRRRLMLPVSWAGDHRVVEGAEMAAFVECWRAWVEVPERLIGVGV